MRRQGSEFEDRAADYLVGLGYTIVTRRVRAKGGELDLVALDGDQFVFVEVKQRRAGYIPEESVGVQKRDRLFRAAANYLRENGLEHRDRRFDVVAFDPDGIRHHQGVFNDYADLPGPEDPE